MAEFKGVLKPSGQFVFDVLDPQKPLAENWVVLETYLGAEVSLEHVALVEKTIEAAGTKVILRHPGATTLLDKTGKAETTPTMYPTNKHLTKGCPVLSGNSIGELFEFYKVRF